MSKKRTSSGNPATTVLVSRINTLARLYYSLTSGPMIDAEAVLSNRGKMLAALDSARKSNHPETLLVAELTILNVDRVKLQEVVESEQEAGRALSPELKRDVTSLDDGIRDMNQAANVFLARQRYGEEAYHDISVLSRSTKEVDASGVAIDVLRKNTKSHETRLGNMASGTSQTEIGRKNQAVIGLRRQNMADCRILYVARQREFLTNRA